MLFLCYYSGLVGTSIVALNLSSTVNPTRSKEYKLKLIKAVDTKAGLCLEGQHCQRDKQQCAS